MGESKRIGKSEKVKYHKKIVGLLKRLLLLYNTVYKDYEISLCNIIRSDLTIYHYESDLLLTYLYDNSPKDSCNTYNYWFELRDRQSRIDWLEKHIKRNKYVK